jgi:hypothetical protein
METCHQARWNPDICWPTVFGCSLEKLQVSVIKENRCARTILLHNYNNFIGLHTHARARTYTRISIGRTYIDGKFSVGLLRVEKAKVKVKLSLCFNWAPLHKGVLGEWRYSSTHSLTLALHVGEWSPSHAGRSTLRERAPDTLWMGGCVGPRAVLEAVVKRKIPSPHRESNPRTPIVQPVVQRYTE